jgi:ribonuclease R
VRPGSELDRSARLRGNSVYFPDRVVPMLPEILSADVCSLKEGEDRAALACHLTIAADGTLRGWRFSRALVRIAANIAYEDAQAAIDGAGEGDPTRCRRRWSRARSGRSGRAGRRWRRRATGARRSTSICPSGAWCSTRRAASCRSPRASGWRRIA